MLAASVVGGGAFFQPLENPTTLVRVPRPSVHCASGSRPLLGMRDRENHHGIVATAPRPRQHDLAVTIRERAERARVGIRPGERA